jgi:hypothetical protein
VNREFYYEFAKLFILNYLGGFSLLLKDLQSKKNLKIFYENTLRETKFQNSI